MFVVSAIEYLVLNGGSMRTACSVPRPRFSPGMPVPDARPVLGRTGATSVSGLGSKDTQQIRRPGREVRSREA